MTEKSMLMISGPLSIVVTGCAIRYPLQFIAAAHQRAICAQLVLFDLFSKRVSQRVIRP